MGFDTFEKIGDFLYRCKTCGKEVHSGIFSMSGHWAECTGKVFTSLLMDKAQEKNGKLTVEDIEEIKSKTDN